MVIDESSLDQINTTIITLERRIKRIKDVMDKFSDDLKKCQSLDDVKKLSLKINEVRI